MEHVQATERELKREAERIVELMCSQGLFPWMAKEVVEREAIPMYWERLIPMVEKKLQSLC